METDAHSQRGGINDDDDTEFESSANCAPRNAGVQVSRGGSTKAVVARTGSFPVILGTHEARASVLHPARPTAPCAW